MRRFIAYGLTIALLAACSTQEKDFQTPVQDDVVFYASFEQPSEEGTRVYANEDLLLRWTADDRISIFNKNTYNQQYQFVGETGDNAGGFRKVDSDEFVTGNTIPHVVSVYPYQEATKITESEFLTVTLPAEQSYAENTFGLGANTMVSVSSDNVLLYKNVGGYLMIKLFGEGVSVESITLKGNNGEKLAGKASISMPLDGTPTAVMADEATTEITLTCPEPVTLGATAEESKQFWFVVPPTTFWEGFTVVIDTNDGKRFEKSTTGSLTISRNNLSKMAPLEVVPAGPKYHFLTFISEGTTTVTLTNEGGNAPVLYYSTNRFDWSPWDYSELIFTRDQPLYICGDNPDGFSTSFNLGWSSEPVDDIFSRFTTSGSDFGISGNIMSLIDKDQETDVIPSTFCFCNLFDGCTGLVAAPELPATALTNGCYSYMFHGCTGLTAAPELPATVLTEFCYLDMFSDCTKLTTAPKLPATTLANACYWDLFAGCTSITTAPELPATTLADNCYGYLFWNCTNLTTAPTLPATTLAQGCYTSMFNDCTSLTKAPDLPATTLAQDFYWGMFIDCTSLTKVPDLPATTLADNGYCDMFAGCTRITTAPKLPATTLANACYCDMFAGCTSITTAPELPATTLADYCYAFMFRGCANLTKAPDLPATTLAPACYKEMFSGCTNLNHVRCLASVFSHYSTYNWLEGVASTGTFVKATGMNDWPNGISGIPEGWTIINDSPLSIPESVDLGLSVKWASFNLGATKPEEYGDYYAWGETTPYYSSQDPLTWKDGKTGYDWASYKWCMGTDGTLTKYCSKSGYGYKGFTDTKTVLDPEDDAAHVNLGGTWRMPTDAEWTELRDNCTWTWTTQNGVNGMLFTASNGNSIFLPAAGFRGNTSFFYVGSLGYYWSSSLYTVYPDNAWDVIFYSGNVYRDHGSSRCSGQSVRPVYAE